MAKNKSDIPQPLSSDAHFLPISATNLFLITENFHQTRVHNIWAESRDCRFYVLF